MHKILLIGTVLTLFGAAQPALSEEGESLRCEVMQLKFIRCRVLEINLRINGLTLNRGRCRTPEQAREEAVAQNNECIRRNGGSQNCLSPKLFQPNPDQETVQIAQKLFGGQPFPEYRRQYDFGERFIVWVSCPNILEMTFFTSSGNKTLTLNASGRFTQPF
jgi:hypothetical protein